MNFRSRATLGTAAILTVAAACATQTPGAASPATGLRPADPAAAIAARASQTAGAILRVAAWRLDGGGARIVINGDSLVHAASTMKVPVLMELAREADRGTLDLDATVVLVNRFRSIVDGSTYALNRAEDSDDSVHARVGAPVPIRWLASRMITHSSNLATNMLLTVVNADTVTALTRRLGASRMLVRRGVEDGPAFRAGLNNVTTARDLATLMAAIGTDRAASPASCAWMRDVLFAQAWNDAIPAGLPAGTRIAHKTGNITAVEHDAALVYPPRSPPYVLVVLTSGIASQAEATRLIADVARIVHASLAP